MTLQRLKINAPANFPVSTFGTGGIKVSKERGIWTIEPDFAALADITVLNNPTAKQVWVFDPMTGEYNVMTLSAVGGSLFSDTSSTPVTIGLGVQTFAVNPGKMWSPGNYLMISEASNPTNFMLGQIVSYTGSSLVVNVAQASGSGTHVNWTISLSGSPGKLGNAAIEYTLDGMGQPLVAGQMGSPLEVPFACTIQRITLVADAVGACSVDIWRAPFASLPPVIANSITGGNLPALNASQTFQDTALASWNTMLNAGDFLAFVVNNPSGISRLTVSLLVSR
ncbi:MAG TPA: hypothetical protein VHN11_07960 [Xanthobacteraceae bacterium]|jgi:hypothetical protein|nr:hypothetical protein [Xanthobacteraceae bacterium]